MRKEKLKMYPKTRKAAQTPETIYARGKTAEWLLCAIEQGFVFWSDFFDCLDWCCGGLRGLLRSVIQDSHDLNDSPSVHEARQALQEISTKSSRRLGHELEEISEEHPCLREIILAAAIQECSEASKMAKKKSELYLRATRQMKRIFGLDQKCLRLCEFVFINQSFSAVESYFEDELSIYKHGRRRIFARILGMSLSDLRASIHKLSDYGLLDTNHCFRLPDQLFSFWEDADRSDMEWLSCRPLEGEVLPLGDFHIAPNAAGHAVSLLKKMGNDSVHILLYGAPGTGKTTFARSLARACGIRAWAVSSRREDDDRDRRASLAACLHMASRYKGAFVLVDEAERLLDTSRNTDNQTKDKAWLNDFLEQPGKRVVWVTNQVEHIDQAVRRRFTFSIHFEELKQQDLLRTWDKILRKHRVKRLLTTDCLVSFARNYQVPAAVIENAVSQAKILCEDNEDFKFAIERILYAYTTLRYDGRSPRIKPQAAADFIPEGVCLEGSAAELLSRSRRVDAAMREMNLPRPGLGTMLFYGPSGTGKTALARYVAKELGRECLLKRASDLLNPYLGMSEQNVAEAFREAERDGAVLVIDEADTFLFSRDTAQRSWETSLVNEFLTALEECRSFCICTTNRRESLDAAVMRRFSHKVAFGYARPNQILSLYMKLLAPLCVYPLSVKLKEKLVGLGKTTPGDFHAVRSRFDPLLEDDLTVDHDTLIEALQKEQSLKTEEYSKCIGFI